MLSILWIIIKIILIILLCILGILLAGILIVLLVPLRYGAQLSWLEQKANGSVKISWLFRIVMFCMEVKDNQISTKVLLFGRDFKKGRTSRKRSLPENAAAERRTRGEQAEKKEKIVPSKEMIPEEEVPEQTKPEQKIPKPPGMAEEDTSSKEDTETHPGVFEKLRKRMDGLKQMLIRIRENIQAIWNKIKSGKMKWDRWMELYHDENNQNSLRLLKKEGIRILRQMAPRTFRVNLHVGLGEPASTGLLLGAAACLMPIYEDSVRLEPEFEEAVLEGDMLVKGRIRLGTFVLTAIRLWKDKNLRSLIKRMIK